MITSFTIREVEPDKDGRNLMVSLIRGKQYCHSTIHKER